MNWYYVTKFYQFCKIKETAFKLVIFNTLELFYFLTIMTREMNVGVLQNLIQALLSTTPLAISPLRYLSTELAG